MNLENVKYDAFISYRHCESDKFVAEQLHKQLESFKIPKSLINTGKTKGKTKIERVFRDRDELPLASNLADPITKALQSSDYLIVICSPRLPESKWCLKEIETFISMHGREHILAVLIEGEPIDSFPDILRYDKKEIIDADGNVHVEKIEVEPLAADVRGKNKREISKQIKNELMRLIAPMLNCNYDDLKMRHKEARQKKILRISFAISLVCLLFTAISTTMALTIHKQSITIEEQYQTALRNQAISYAAISQTLLEQEDRMAAMAIARMALPDTLINQQEMPYTAAAEFALSDSLAIYNNGESNFPIKSLEQNSPIRFMEIAPDESTITTVDTNSIITIFDVETASTITSFTTKDENRTNIYDETGITYLDANKLVYIAKRGFCIYDIPTKTETFYDLDASSLYVSTSSDGEYIGICTTQHFNIFDKNGSCIYSHAFSLSHTGDSAIAFHPKESLCAFTFTDKTNDTQKKALSVINCVTGQEIYTAEFDISYFNDCVFYGDQLLVSGQKDNYSTDGFLDYTADTHVLSFPLDSNTPNWKFVKKDSSFNDMAGTLQWENKTIVLAGYDEITFIDSKDGSMIHSTSLGSPIVDVAPLATEGSILASTEQGEKTFVNYDPSYDNIVIEEFDTSNGEFSDFYYSNNFVAAFHNNSTTVTIYQETTSDKAKTVASFHDYITHGAYSSKQHAFLTASYNNQYLLKRDDTENVTTLTHNTYAHDMFFLGDNDEQIALVDLDNITYYNATNGEFLNQISVSDAFNKTGIIPSTYIDCTKDRETLIYASRPDNTICLYSIKDKTATIIPIPKDLPSATDSIGINETGDKYAIACTQDNTLSIFDNNSNLIINTEINAALVNNIIISDTANCVIVSYLDKTVSLYQLSDLSVLKTFTNIRGDIEQLDTISFSNNDSNAPAYALYGISECYLLDKELEPIARLYNYIACDEEHQLFYLSNDNYILSVPYYNYNMLIEEADKTLKNYELSNYRRNQLDI